MCYTIYIEFRYERYRYLSSLFERGECIMTFTNKTIDYRVTLDTKLNLFIVFSKNMMKPKWQPVLQSKMQYMN